MGFFELTPTGRALAPSFSASLVSWRAASSRRPAPEIFGNDGGIDLGDGAIGQAGPGLVAAEQRDADIAAQRQGLPIRAQGHLGAVDLAVAGIEHVAVL